MSDRIQEEAAKDKLGGRRVRRIVQVGPAAFRGIVGQTGPSRVYSGALRGGCGAEHGGNSSRARSWLLDGR
ncbi:MULTISPECIES: hypothetical protein [Nitrosomonas]|uniref:Uncharacterized protein n=1 Tax=Nitrosomonas communis TaxID=44574 RepID=A0A0F7KG30_9PROT|nr:MULTISPECIES: hypothetical protein [Nitrosomonas]AKH38133.1 hypothetical protein AAW31_10445 [Nitrosomonas communis]UVS60063.1 hypothetical protein NX761_11000 [Nitrosomonas sp. PLL12]